ncbi:MAG: SLATT domain-containing protein [Planctomycetes bacterium]|nr:SLATT domain-containing protein [Planctomycetota bacterium]
MTKKPKNIIVEDIGPWDEYVKVDVKDALPNIYKHAKNSSKKARDWYWEHKTSKQWASLIIRSVSFVLLVCGVVFPIFAGISDEVNTRLFLTQFGVAVLAIAGLLQAGDRIFGWSSGWLRYITTVTAMESATQKFDLDWADYFIKKTGELGNSDKQPLFQLAKRLIDDISKLQSDETEKWVAEFNTSLALLSDLIKSQRESSEKAAEAAREAVAAKEIAAADQEKAQQPGAIEISFAHKAAPIEIMVHLDDEPDDVPFVGTTWSRNQVAPGLHTVHVTTTKPTSLQTQKTVKVPAGDIVRVEIELS